MNVKLLLRVLLFSGVIFSVSVSASAQTDELNDLIDANILDEHFGLSELSGLPGLSENNFESGLNALSHGRRRPPPRSRPAPPPRRRPAPPPRHRPPPPRHRPAPPPYYGTYTCYAQDQLGFVYRGQDMHNARRAQDIAMNNCYWYSHSCWPRGCEYR